ncbi:alpha-glucosidase/alpha-galactosidase [Salibacterium halotolerans]|uniref:Alpha-galactosidase n=1 Tax=Salibacterium halotolerans TaxID=1884432 RepID=A0A1I5KVI1_9BACI|nr:alpha-glucosidase/alpha-galactosidase [Salibacterium halotolerans]SFO88938.1 alpha-galactosidase [Salibacterium halotolerans]
MTKVTFIGAGSTVFAKNILGDCIVSPKLQHLEIALYDIDKKRLHESEQMLIHLTRKYNSKIEITVYDDRKTALHGASYVINAIQVGGYDPSTIIDFEVPKKYGLEQTIGDTNGIGGLFRNLRTIPVMLNIAKDMREVCPEALFMNYTNPMSALTKVMTEYGGIHTVGLCHSVQMCVPELFQLLDMDDTGVTSKIAGINHMAWLLEVQRDGVDLYPEIKRRAKEKQKKSHDDMVRLDMMEKFGYYLTESSEHNAEYYPFYIKRNYPKQIERFNIPLDEYPRRCVAQLNEWEKRRDEFVENDQLTHERSKEYASYMIEAMEHNEPMTIGGNVMNHNRLIPNLPEDACVEVSCVVDASGITPEYAGKLPQQLAALNRNAINTQIMSVEAAITGKKEHVYQAAMLDPHTAAELSPDDIIALCDELIERHGNWLPSLQ